MMEQVKEQQGVMGQLMGQLSEQTRLSNEINSRFLNLGEELAAANAVTEELRSAKACLEADLLQVCVCARASGYVRMRLRERGRGGGGRGLKRLVFRT